MEHGSIAIDYRSGYRPYLHELGHLFGMAHYPAEEEWKKRLMYISGSSNKYVYSSTTCRDCNRFGVMFEDHATINSSFRSSSCRSLSDNDAGVAGIIIAGGTPQPVESDDIDDGCSIIYTRSYNNIIFILVLFVFNISRRRNF